MVINPQSPFDPFHIDSLREEESWLVDREPIRLRRRRSPGPNGLQRQSRHRRWIGVAMVMALAVGAIGFGHLWFAIP